MSWGAALGGLIGGVLGIKGGADANQANWDNARAAEQFSERMRNTAHQAQVNDLRAAGLNPILSANSGASSPSGVMAQSENIMEGASATAMEIARVKTDLEKQKAEIGALEATKNKTENDAALSRAQRAKVEKETRILERDIPRAEMMSELYNNLGKPIIDKLKEATEFNSRPHTPLRDEADKRAKELKQKYSPPRQWRF